MVKLAHSELVVFLLSISTMLIVSRIFAELGKQWKLPVVMGELIVGIILGPTILGQISPQLFNYLFPFHGNIPIALDCIFSLSVIMLLFVAGMEVQLPVVLKQGKVAIYTSTFSMIIPFVTGFAVAWYFPDIFHIQNDPDERFLFALFLGTALSISALPVIARILMDMNLFQTNIGMVIIASAMFNDLIGWLIFSLVLSLTNKTNHQYINLGSTIAYIICFGLFMLTIGKKIIDKSLPWIQTKLSWPGGVLSISLGICLLSAAFTESIHIHAILGAFIAGIAVGDSVHLREQAREIIHQFVTNFFAPLFFVSIGLKVNFIENFDFPIVAIVLVLAFIGKLVGATTGARLGGMSRNHAFAVGFGMNARGAMEIILGTLALNAGLISKPVFVALIIMALITSLSSGPLMRKFID
ncbi:MAG TPA: cation:proton antiporter [Bacteroidia bacterium]|jgi:Kef-type K+ transport system membrane component KefB|nr:cation:proton antiporter [Bacteroidia bacterium]